MQVLVGLLVVTVVFQTCIMVGMTVHMREAHGVNAHLQCKYGKDQEEGHLWTGEHHD